MSTPTESGTLATPVATPLVLPLSRAAVWMFATLLAALAVYYVVGVEQGAWSVLGSGTNLHEFLHDGRHLLGFPCH